MKKKVSTKDNIAILFKRYVWLVDILYRKEKLTFEEINSYWLSSSLNFDGNPLPLRTFHNHRRAIEQMFNIDIECDRKNGFRYYIEDVEELEQNGAKSWMLNYFAINLQISENQMLKKRILFEQVPSGQKFLTVILESMKENHVIELTYQNFWREKSNTFLVHPYCVKLFKQRWYLIAYSPSKEMILIYALDRICSILLTKNQFKIPSGFSAEQFFSESYGIIVDNNVKQEVVVLKAKSNTDKYIKSLPLHHSQQVIETSTDHTTFSLYLKPTYDFIQEILSHGAAIEVLKPKSLRDEIKRIISLQYKTYKI